MIKYLGIFILALIVAFALTTTSAFSQEDLGSKFLSYNKSHLQEKLFVHTDKSFYLAGEVLWFKLYAVDGILNQPLDLSKVAYVEVIDRNHGQQMKAKIKLKGGSGNGSFFIPLTLNSGNYLLRAYTYWMKNFGPELYFEKEITIVNSVKAPVKFLSADTAKYDIQFFPEGGYLVNGIRSRLGFRVVGRDGKGRMCNGIIRDQSGQEVARIQTFKFGLGNFYLTPQAGNHYEAEISIENEQPVKVSLPSPKDQGFVMQVSDSLADDIYVSVYSKGGAGNESLNLFVNTRQSAKLLLTKSLQDHHAEFLVKKSALGEGVSFFTLFTENLTPLCERLYFKAPTAMNISLSAPKSEFNTRQKAQVDVATMANAAVPADLSVSVFLVDSLQHEEGNILSYFWLSSDLTGKVESPDYYFAATGAEQKQAIDNLMLTHGWRRFKWQDVLAPQSAKGNYAPEYEAHMVTGKITDKRTGQPASGVPAYVSVRGINFLFNAATSDSDGNVKVSMPNFYGNEEIVVQTDPIRDSAYRIEVLNPFSDKFSSDSIQPFGLSASLQHTVVSHSIGTQVQNAFFPDSSQKFNLPDADTNVFYGKPDKRYYLDDYTRFTSLEEIFREYVEEVGVRKPEGKSKIMVLRDDRSFNNDDPIMLLDGVPYFNMDTVLHFDPLKIRRLDVMKRKYFTGLLVNGGVVSMTTYNGDLSASTLDPNAVILEYEGLQIEREFFSPVYETDKQIKSRLPDMRSVLYWSPNLHTNETGKGHINFYTSDQPGNYLVVVQGIDAGGKAGAAVYPIIVK